VKRDTVCRWWFSDSELSEVADAVERADREELKRRPGTGPPPADAPDPEETTE
jgi:hypothetical protein